MILEFEYYVRKGVVRKDVRDVSRAKSLVKIAKERLKAAEKLRNPSFRLEFIYEAIIEMIEAILALRGYKSYSHEANIAYLRKLKFPESTILTFDKLRRKRHRSKYYGASFDEKEVRLAKEFAEKVIAKLEKIIFDELQ
jgi:hypothetical protein